MHLRLVQKLKEIRACPDTRTFILADAKDPDMAWGIASPGHVWPSDEPQLRSMDQLHDEMRAIVRQGMVDILLASASSISRLAREERFFADSDVTPAVRVNDTTDIWAVRGNRYQSQPSQPFATCGVDEARFASSRPAADAVPLVGLGLYSITFVNELQADLRSLEAFRRFRATACERGFHYLLEVFAPNVDCGLSAEQIPAFVNDCVVRTLAGIPCDGRPEFLKMPFFGPRHLEELVQYDRQMIVGILGGSSGTTHDAFKLIAEAQRYGARAALFGRKIKDAEDPLAFIELLRRIVDQEIDPAEAVRAYHGRLQQRGLPPRRSLEDDLQLTAQEFSYLR